MNSDKRKRINVTVSADEYERLCRLRDRHGFGTLCRMARGVLMELCRRAETRRRPEPDADEGHTDSRYIEAMFGELSEYERHHPGAEARRP